MVTMDKSSAQHHYVPRFCLSQFASKAKRINIYNLEGKFVKEDINLREQCRRPTGNDIDSINAFQIVSAETNVYFSDWTHKDRLTDLVLEKRQLRSTDATVLEEFESGADENDSLVHFYAETPNLGLNLSFLQVKKRASRVSMGKRIGNSQRQARPVTRGARTGKAITYSKLVAKI